MSLSLSEDRGNRTGRILPFRLGALARDPFVHFALLGAAMFGVNHYLEERARVTRITITSEQLRRIADKYFLQYGGLPSQQQLSGLADNFVKEEIFYREALRLGLDVGDEIIRRRLVQKYEFLQQDLATPAEPTESQLRTYYRQHPDKYLRPETVTFRHIYFSTDLRGENGAREATQELASNLNLRRVSRAVEDGDRFAGMSYFAAVSREELGRVFGKDGLAEVIFKVAPQQWSAPLRSGFGWHTVYISARQPSREAPFDEVRQHVRLDYLDSERNQRNAEAFAKLRESFKIIRE